MQREFSHIGCPLCSSAIWLIRQAHAFLRFLWLGRRPHQQTRGCCDPTAEKFVLRQNGTLTDRSPEGDIYGYVRIESGDALVRAVSPGHSAGPGRPAGIHRKTHTGGAASSG